MLSDKKHICETSDTLFITIYHQSICLQDPFIILAFVIPINFKHNVISVIPNITLQYLKPVPGLMSTIPHKLYFTKTNVQNYIATSVGLWAWLKYPGRSLHYHLTSNVSCAAFSSRFKSLYFSSKPHWQHAGCDWDAEWTPGRLTSSLWYIDFSSLFMWLYLLRMPVSSPANCSFCKPQTSC